ncbi:hypothetical protein SAMN05421840_102104 [Shewanella morhuae]|nr:hypothetical protein SAMN05421840_102104 [Shewanella morhuae]
MCLEPNIEWFSTITPRLLDIEYLYFTPVVILALCQLIDLNIHYKNDSVSITGS